MTTENIFDDAAFARFARTRTPEQLKEFLAFHEKDTRATTMAAELGRLWYIQKYTEELRDRGIEVSA